MYIDNYEIKDIIHAMRGNGVKKISTEGVFTVVEFDVQGFVDNVRLEDCEFDTTYSYYTKMISRQGNIVFVCEIENSQDHEFEKMTGIKLRGREENK